MNTRFKELVEAGRIALSTPQKKNERIEVYVEGDINDGDYVNDTHVSFTYIDADGNEYPSLNTKEEARDHKIEKVVE